MSQQFKINGTLLSIIISAIGAWMSVVWIASSKANDIKVHGDAIEALKAAEKSTQAMLQRLDERTTLILETIRRK